MIYHCSCRFVYTPIYIHICMHDTGTNQWVIFDEGWNVDTPVPLWISWELTLRSTSIYNSQCDIIYYYILELFECNICSLHKITCSTQVNIPRANNNEQYYIPIILYCCAIGSFWSRGMHNRLSSYAYSSVADNFPNANTCINVVFEALLASHSNITRVYVPVWGRHVTRTNHPQLITHMIMIIYHAYNHDIHNI